MSENTCKIYWKKNADRETAPFYVSTSVMKLAVYPTHVQAIDELPPSEELDVDFADSEETSRVENIITNLAAFDSALVKSEGELKVLQSLLIEKSEDFDQ